MRHASPSYVPPRLHARADAGALEWEELPSSAESLARGGVGPVPTAADGAPRSSLAAPGRPTRALELDVDLDALAAAGTTLRQSPVTPRDIVAPGLLRHFLGL